jgi:hypothetical protein
MGYWVSRERSAPLGVISFEHPIGQNQLPAEFVDEIEH